MVSMNVRVMYEAAPIMEIAVECPKCKRWFRGRDITSYPIRYEVDISRAYFGCPVCGETFNGFDDIENPIAIDTDCTFKLSNVNIEEVRSEDECHKDCLKGKVVWEN